MKRVCTPELLDTDCGTPEEVGAALADMHRINRWFGGVATSHSLVKRVATTLGKTTLSLLDVASGHGEVPEAVSHRMRASGVQVGITLLDRAVTHLVNGHPRKGRHMVAADVMALPFRDGSFDVVSCCLFAHHLGVEQLAQFVNEALRVCRGAVVINDLIRSPIHLGMVYASLPLYRSPITQHDAPASVRQAFTVNEMRSLLSGTNASQVEIGRRFLFRMAAVAWK